MYSTHDRLLTRLENRWSENAYVDDVSDIIIDEIKNDNFKCYIKYAKNYKNQINTLTELW